MPISLEGLLVVSPLIAKRTSDGKTVIFDLLAEAWVALDELGGGGGPGGVTSVFGRAGDVVAEPFDYHAAMVAQGGMSPFPDVQSVLDDHEARLQGLGSPPP